MEAVRRQCGRSPPDRTADTQALRAAGMSELQIRQLLPVTTAPVPFELWPENETAFALWCSLRTQWRVGPAGLIGLDYAAIPAVMELQGIPPDQRPALFAALRQCEAVALDVFYQEK